jgi:anti-anti-sigma factor
MAHTMAPEYAICVSTRVRKLTVRVESVMRVELIFNGEARHAVVCVAGEVDIATVAELEDGFRQAIAVAPRVVICDLRQVTFFAVAGLHCLERAMDDLTRIDTPLHLVVSAHVERSPVLRLTMPIWHGPVHHSLDEAMSGALSQLGEV